MAPEGIPGSTRARLPFGRRVALELVGTAFLLAAIVGSGIMGERLASGNTALALLANSLATGAVLVALIVALGPLSGAHLNPLVTLASVIRKTLPAREAGGYIFAQVGGAFLGVALAHGMFGQAIFSTSSHARPGAAQGLSEFVATFGLLAVVWATAHRAVLAPFAVAGYVTGAYWFTSSTCFANPAVTVARAATDTFAGIRLSDVPLFLLGQIAGAAAAIGFLRWVFVPVRDVPRTTATGRSRD